MFYNQEWCDMIIYQKWRKMCPCVLRRVIFIVDGINFQEYWEFSKSFKSSSRFKRSIKVRNSHLNIFPENSYAQYYMWLLVIDRKFSSPEVRPKFLPKIWFRIFCWRKVQAFWNFSIFFNSGILKVGLVQKFATKTGRRVRFGQFPTIPQSSVYYYICDVWLAVETEYRVITPHWQKGLRSDCFSVLKRVWKETGDLLYYTFYTAMAFRSSEIKYWVCERPAWWTQRWETQRWETS